MGLLFQKHAATVDEAEAVVGALVSKAGFARTKRCEWRRRAPWKFEVVELLPRKDDCSLLPSLWVGIEQLDQVMAFANIAKVLDPEGSIPRIPVPVFRPAVSAFVARLAKDIEASLPWFDQFATPALCKQSLPRFKKIDAPLFREFMAHLGSVEFTS